ncbi:iron complex transport system substrate-binding protein [Scopulibacillus daqui]|uniref:Iron complex transport system substrate-binding protein n=1 Tax=Scopulibacillus daqui TaxID=1469162 RepID=A0ABS2Q2Z4_9BACL|nr:cobalamin-binding protein [Scopulibacillus daqui]MBM7646069.1 iron complex transport system substrate-binding protein [Scopulibacillus daqui]
MRIVSICPSNTEMLAYLQLMPQVVGVDNYSDWPEDIKTLPRLGPDLSIDMDKTASLKPDLVVASLSVPGMERNIEELKARGLPYVVLNPHSLKQIGDDLIMLGELTNRKSLAEEVVRRYHETIHQYQTLAHKVSNKPSIYWEWWPKPVFTPGGRNWLTEISRLAGAINLFENEPKANVQTSWEDVIARQPDHICMIWVGVDSHKVKPDFVIKRNQAKTMKAVIKGNIHVLEEAYFCRPSPRLLMGLKKIAALLHPEIFPAFSNNEDSLYKLKKT